MQQVKRDLQDELFTCKILEKIIPERRYSCTDIPEQELYKQLQKTPGPLTPEVRRKVASDL